MAVRTSSETKNVTFEEVKEMYRVQWTLCENIKNDNYNTRAITELGASITMSIMALVFAWYPPLSLGLSLASLAAAVESEKFTKLYTIADRGFEDISILYTNMSNKNYVRANITIQYIHEDRVSKFGVAQRVIINSVTTRDGQIIAA